MIAKERKHSILKSVIPVSCEFLCFYRLDFDGKKCFKKLRKMKKKSQKTSITTRNTAIPELWDQIIVSTTSSNNNILLHVFLLFTLPNDLKHYSRIVMKICHHTRRNLYRILNKFIEVKYTNYFYEKIILQFLTLIFNNCKYSINTSNWAMACLQ